MSVAAGPPEGAGLYRKLVLLTCTRLLVGTALLVATAWLTLGHAPVPHSVEVWLYAIIASMYVASLVATFLLRTGRNLSVVAHLQVAADVAAATGLVYLTGGAESIFTILYPLAIVNGAIALGRRGAAVGAAASALGFCLLVWGTEIGWFEPAAYLERSVLPPGRLTFVLAANLSAFLLVGALAAFLAEQLQGARTKLRESETRLEALQTIYSAVVRSITSGIITVDQAGNVTYLNPAAEQLIGLADASARGQPLHALLPELAQSMVERPAPSVRNEVKLKASDGRQRILGYAVAPLSGPLPGLVILFQDLTDLRHMEETVRRSDRLAVVGGLAAGLAHEIRNPLASMCGSIEALGASPRLDAQERKLMRVVRDEAERLEALVRDFLSFARPASPSFENVPGARAIEETVDLFKSRADVQGLDVLVNADDSLVLRADARQFRQVLWNLLGNAAEATQKGGKVEVKLGRQGAHALLEVSDSGEGIAQGDLGRIFDPFYTTKERGTGLGLAIVHRIVEAHGGELSVKSEQGRGSTFRVALPAVRPV